MFTNVNIALQVIPIFTFVNIGSQIDQHPPKREDSVDRATRTGYSKYWNLLVEKANVTVKPLPGSEAAVTSMPILEHRRATR